MPGYRERATGLGFQNLVLRDCPDAEQISKNFTGSTVFAVNGRLHLFFMLMG